MRKTCTKCGDVLDISEFAKHAGHKDGRTSTCKTCNNYTAANYRIKLRSKIKLDPEFRKKHLEKHRAYTQKWKKNNQQKLSEYLKRSAKQRAATTAAYYKKNKSYFLHLQNIKGKNDPETKIRRNAAARIRNSLKQQGLRKNSKTEHLVGCSFAFLKTHIESQFKDGMSWSNYGFRGWHIDHIRPCASFDLTSEVEQAACFHWSNLQPLWWRDNLSKSDRLITKYSPKPLGESLARGQNTKFYLLKVADTDASKCGGLFLSEPRCDSATC